MGRAVSVTLVLALLVPGSAAAQTSGAESPPAANDFSCQPSAEHPRPVVLVHGFGSTAGYNWNYHSPRIAAAGYCVFALTYGRDARNAGLPYNPGGITRMQESSGELEQFVARVLDETGAEKVDLIGQSEGTVMPRWYLERRGGAPFVQNFVALTPAWRGSELGGGAIFRDLALQLGFTKEQQESFYAFCGSCPQSLRGSDYLNELNADGEAVPGIVHTNIVTRYDELVIPYTSGFMRDGGTNILLQDVCPLNLSEHILTTLDPVVSQLFLNALDPSSAQPVRC